MQTGVVAWKPLLEGRMEFNLGFNVFSPPSPMITKMTISIVQRGEVHWARFMTVYIVVKGDNLEGPDTPLFH